MAAEHVLRSVLRRAAPYALSSLEAEIERAERAVARTAEAVENLDTGASIKRVNLAERRNERACSHLEQLVRLRIAIKEAVRG
jgi:hypothetical protein